MIHFESHLGISCVREQGATDLDLVCALPTPIASESEVVETVGHRGETDVEYVFTFFVDEETVANDAPVGLAVVERRTDVSTKMENRRFACIARIDIKKYVLYSNVMFRTAESGTELNIVLGPFNLVGKATDVVCADN